MNVASGSDSNPNAGRVYLIDASVYVFRAWFSVPDSLCNAHGEPINALHGFARFLVDLRRRVGPTAPIAVAFDESLSHCFRNRIYPAYKAQRPPAPEALHRQFAWCRSLCSALGLPQHADREYEADDILGAWTTQARAEGRAVTLVTRDKDLTQLIGPTDQWWDFAGDVRLDAAGVEQKMGVRPDQVADWLALTGDSVDNIPGVAGVGPKAATALLAHFGDLQSVLENLDVVATLPIRGAKSLALKLAQNAEQALLSRALTGIAAECPGVPNLSWPELPQSARGLDDALTALHLGAGLRQQLQIFSQV